MEVLDVLAALKGTDRVLLDTVMQPEILEQQMQQINDIYFKVFDELYDIIREGDEMAFCYFSSWAPGKMSKMCIRDRGRSATTCRDNASRAGKRFVAKMV